LKKITIGICSYDEEKNIGTLLNSLLREQGLGKDYEIIIVHSGCKDSTLETIKYFCNKDARIKLIIEKTRNGKISALNKILKLCQGDILIHISADILPMKNALKILLNHFNDPNVGAVSCHQIPLNGNGFVDKIIKVIWNLHSETQSYYSRKGIAHLGGDMFAIRKEICNQIPEDIVNDDAYMGILCKHKGFKVLFEKKALSYFYGPDNLRDLIIQRRRIVYGHLKVKKVTNEAPKVLEMCPLIDKIVIISHFIRKNIKLMPYFIIACFLELFINILARLDILKNKNPHKVWKIALSTKKN
jgi:cellulose synthase/poly-beta-1,6-N-acetylglucosamine synthase-like glycosyltransferase